LRGGVRSRVETRLTKVNLHQWSFDHSGCSLTHALNAASFSQNHFSYLSHPADDRVGSIANEVPIQIQFLAQAGWLASITVRKAIFLQESWGTVIKELTRCRKEE
jgi:hypothetical protein